jgi:hypothetical protein
MAVPAENPLLETPGPARAILQQLHVMVGFQHEGVGGTDPFDNELRDVAEVGEETDVGPIRPQQIADGILGIVRNGECFDEDIADFKTGAGGEHAAIEPAFDLVLNGLVRGAIAKNREAQFRGKRAEALNVIAVFVGDDDAGQIFRDAADRGQTLADLPRAEPGIDENAGFVGLHVGAVSGRTASKNRQMNRHG